MKGKRKGEHEGEQWKGKKQKHARVEEEEEEEIRSYRFTCRRCEDDRLFCYPEVMACTLSGCIPCAYKLVVQPFIKHEQGSRFRPNRRPEECIRMRAAASSPPAASDLAALLPKSSILTVGDGDLTFSMSMARRLRASEHAGCFVATTHLSRRSLEEAYGKEEIGKTIRELEASGAVVLHEVDATDLSSSISRSCRKSRQQDSNMISDLRFDLVVWNFPCVDGGKEGKDAQLEEIEQNKDLMSKFFMSVIKITRQGGQVHVSHKTKPPFCHWNLPELAESAGHKTEQEELRLGFVRRVVFDRSMFPSYHNRKVATGRGRFPTWDAVTYVWRCTSRSEKEEEMGGRGAQERVALMHLLRREGMIDRLSEEARRQRSSSSSRGSGEERGCVLDKAGVHELEEEVVVCDGMIRLSDKILDSICKLLLLG
ncbi:hypothetical protein GUITHDRAFT_99236 [Guillardia theta CCMP2712]|uniref:25S rRNA (uridine-N(3))-methyltransferase BMT5-like domain-containing protein n=1 Tax=Guillardia theta (strain CCMP2712) TaxID=905079 RepID=L1K4C9_GUITC|nr:hypothetical protein GUITHDRAFT_99236 [Guillardia theta CCMP2712]EKX55459.1 hypothetical protein GUITHDRAFT_99236 [Guillardia theta CCMP2712]|eukprot:XP_005842439.1 hypothetical protein GUITHDRAFT_99236 [Guillardia theta CCMP2712]